nr:transposase, mutator type [Tanacetum cinerariifolium]
MVVTMGYGVVDLVYYHFLRPKLGLDYGLHPLNVDADVLKMAKYVKDNKIILVYVEHESSNVNSSIFVTPKKGVAIAVDNHLRKALIEIDSSVDSASFVEEPIVEEIVDPFDGLNEILGDYVNTKEEITGKKMIVHIGNSSTVENVLDYDMLFETQGVGPMGNFKEVKVDADNETEEESNTEENDTSCSNSEDLDYDPKHDEVLDDDEHILEDGLVNHVMKTLATKPDILMRAVQDQMQKQFDVGVSMMKAFMAKNCKIDVQQELNPNSPTRTFRMGVYQILTAVGVDANNGIYPVVYAIVEAESKASWCWFLNLRGEDLDGWIDSLHELSTLETSLKRTLSKGIVHHLRRLNDLKTFTTSSKKATNNSTKPGNEINTRNPSASLKNLENQIEQLTKELHFRTINEAPISSTGQCKVVNDDHKMPHRSISSSNLNNLHGVSDFQKAQNEEEKMNMSYNANCHLRSYPWNFTLPCTIGNFNFYSMVDLGASVNVMPRNIFEYLRLANLRNTNMLVELADMRKKIPLGLSFPDYLLAKYGKYQTNSLVWDDTYAEWCNVSPALGTSSQEYNNLRPRDYTFREWTLIKVGHTNISGPVKKALLKLWLIDCFRDESRIIKDPLSRSFYDYKWVFDLEIDQLADEYELGIGKRGICLIRYGNTVKMSIEIAHTGGMTMDLKNRDENSLKIGTYFNDTSFNHGRPLDPRGDQGLHSSKNSIRSPREITLILLLYLIVHKLHLSWFCWITFDYRAPLGFGSIAGGLDHVNLVIRLPIEHGISRDMLWNAARAITVVEFNKKMGQFKSYNSAAYDWLKYLMKRIVVIHKVVAKTIGPFTLSVTTLFDVIKKAATVYIVDWNG